MLSACNSSVEKTKHTVKIMPNSITESIVVGENLELNFFSRKYKNVQLLCTNSYVTELIHPITKDGLLSFEIPKNITQKIGVLSWKIIGSKNELSGNITIQPKTSAKQLETYVGPPSIETRDNDFTMFVTIPADEYDNPIENNTDVHIKHQFLNTITDDIVKTKNFFTYKNIYAPSKSGRLLLSSAVKNTNSKEYSVTVFPSHAKGFTISTYRNHNYADGNQIVTLTTSIIKDKNDNIISDGTYVSFYIKTNTGENLQTQGLTIGGIATAKLLHPYKKSIWNINAEVAGLANSKSVSIVFEQALKDFEVNFLNTNSTIKIGPLQSFMQQKIPDGFKVELAIYEQEQLIKTLVDDSYNGYVNFDLNPLEFKSGKYDLEISSGGIIKSFKNIKL